MPIEIPKSAAELRQDLQAKVNNAMQAQDSNAMVEALATYSDEKCKQMMADYRAMSEEERNDDAVLAQRGVRVLSSAETKYYKALAAAMRQSRGNVQAALTNIDVAMPETIIDAVMEDIQTKFPLLDKINFVNSTYLTKWIYNAQGVQSATWGEFGGAIAGEMSGAFRQLDATACKLTAYFCCPMDFLDMGPRWLDSYVRAVLVEASGYTLETAIVAGEGAITYGETATAANTHSCPIGMMMDLDTASTSETTGKTTYTEKDAITVTRFDPETYGTLLAQLTKTPTGRDRQIPAGGLIMVCNPSDYYTKVFPATTVMAPDGTYRNDVLPYPTTVIQSVGCPSGKAVIGIASQYLALLGVGSKQGGVVTYDDSVHFLNDERVYKSRFLGNGRPADNNSFLVLNISNVKPPVIKTKTES